MLLILFFLYAPYGQANDYFVAPTGNDADTGTLEKPFATIQRAQQAAAPGDTVYLRGGNYELLESHIAKRERIWAYVIHLDKSGKPGKPIRYAAYKEERPVFDFSGIKPNRKRITAFYVEASWVQLEGLEVTGVQVTMLGHTQSICFDNEGSHNLYERLSMHDGQAIGIYSVRGSDNLFLNCDAYNNHDYTSENKKGGNVDGFGCHPTPGSTGNVFRGCRAWFNSDDGFDCITASESVTFENCWAMYNGFSPKFEPLGDGNGFKVGGFAGTPSERLPHPIPRHTVKYCVAARNRSSGFYANHHLEGIDWFHNSAYKNSVNFNMRSRLPDNRTEIDGFAHKLQNNLAYAGRKEVENLDATRSEASHNSFTLGLKLSDHDFLSLDDQQLLRPRTAAGKLPEITFLHPSQNSNLFGQGKNIGLPFTGKSPTLGAFE